MVTQPAASGSAAATQDERNEILRRVNAELASFLDHKLAELPDPGMLPWMQMLCALVLESGKRTRAIFFYGSFRAAGGDLEAPGALAAAAALELFQAGVLIQDDIVDRSDMRRGRPTLHRQLAAWKQQQGEGRDAASFGQAAALILSELCLGWSAALLGRCSADAARVEAVRAIFNRMLLDGNHGQGLELLLMAERSFSVPRCLTVARYKTGRYGFLPPLQIGALLAGAPSALHEIYADVADALGEAYQLRDDLLGAFGDSGTTGKSNVEDLRDGRATVLISLALERATAPQAARIRDLYGARDLDGAGVEELRAILRDTGAVTAVEEIIEARARQALTCFQQAPLPDEAREAFASLISAALYRNH